MGNSIFKFLTFLSISLYFTLPQHFNMVFSLFPFLCYDTNYPSYSILPFLSLFPFPSLSLSLYFTISLYLLLYPFFFFLSLYLCAVLFSLPIPLYFIMPLSLSFSLSLPSLFFRLFHHFDLKVWPISFTRVKAPV